MQLFSTHPFVFFSAACAKEEVGLMLNLRVSIVKARLYIWHICVEPPDAFVTAYVSLLVPAGRRAAPIYVHI